MTLPSPDDVLQEIRRIARDELEVSAELSAGDGLMSGLDLDSLRLTVLAVGLENRYRIRLGEEDAGTLVTLGDLAALVARRVRESQAEAEAGDSTAAPC